MLRIGELSRRLGVSDHVLRAWERRYGLLQPTRSSGGFRLFSETDVARVRRMQAHLAQGLSAAEAARVALAEDQAALPEKQAGLAGDATPRADSSPAVGAGRLQAAGPGLPAADPGPLAAVGEWPGALRRALDAFDEPAAQAVLERLVLRVPTATRRDPRPRA